MVFEELVNFVLDFHGCKSEFKVLILPNSANALNFRKYLSQELGREIEGYFEEEHGHKPTEEVLKFMPAQSLIFETPEGVKKAFIIIFPTIFEILPDPVKLELIIHEAMHIVDYPHILPPNRNLDQMLLMEYLKKC